MLGYNMTQVNTALGREGVFFPKKAKMGIRSLFDHCVNTIALLAVTTSLSGELLYIQLASAQTVQITVATFITR